MSPLGDSEDFFWCNSTVTFAIFTATEVRPVAVEKSAFLLYCSDNGYSSTAESLVLLQLLQSAVCFEDSLRKVDTVSVRIMKKVKYVRKASYLERIMFNLLISEVTNMFNITTNDRKKNKLLLT